MSKRIDELLAAEGAAAEAFEDDQSTPYPENVKISRGNPRSKVLQVRLNPDEFAAIERIAADRKLPASTVAREELLKLIADEASDDVPLGSRLAATLTHMEAISSRLRQRLAESVAAGNLTANLAVRACTDEAPSGRLIGEDTRNPGRGE
jgi:hypothetical protein